MRGGKAFVKPSGIIKIRGICDLESWEIREMYIGVALRTRERM